MTKEEVERLLRHGAYDIFNEEKAGTAEAESNDFIKQDIDWILTRRSTKVVHNDTGSGSNAAGGTFSKASFVAPKTPTGKKGPEEDVDIEDPEFWKKMVGEAPAEAESVLKPRKRNKAIYSEKFYERQLHEMIALDGNGSDSSDDGSDEDEDGSDSEGDGENEERARWGGTKPNQWKKSDALSVLELLDRYGYDKWTWSELQDALSMNSEHVSETEVSEVLPRANHCLLHWLTKRAIDYP